jgi:hypothetical protein
MAYGTPTADNWTGASTGPLYSIGGSVAGLAGTVVLEDNGSDDLSVSATGPFTFASPLGNGSAYSVTVKTNPSGQTCTVTNAAGTVPAANVTNVSVSCATTPAGAVSDNFNRGNGSLGAGWTDMSDGGMAISSQMVVGTTSSYSGDVRTGEAYSSDQYSQIEVTASQLSGGQWIGAAVRAQSGGQNLYVGLYFWNNGNPQLMLFKRINGSWTQLGAYATGPLAAGTQLRLSAAGSALSFSVNGAVYVTASDTSLIGGSPALMAYGTPTADNWTGAGTGSSPPSYTVGGTVAGLAGTVVLQDNGSDNLSVSATGAFTFATPLVNGAPYNVTVEGNPSGQTCSVTYPSGTVAAADITNVSVACMTTPAGAVSDNFNRANGSLGAGWTDMSDGGMAISSQMVVGTTSSYSGDIRTGEAYSSDQYSQIEVTATQLSGGQWIGAAVRAQSGGQNLYAGVYFWNNGSPQLMLFKRISGSWTQLGASLPTAPLIAGSELRLTIVGSALSVSTNSSVRITINDTSLTAGSPAIMASGTPKAGNWMGGNLTFTYVSQDANGVQSYQVTSPDDGNSPQIVRVLRPTHAAPGVAHNFLYLLPVEAGLGNTYGDGMATLEALDAQDQYNLTIIEPSFSIAPWYADNPTNGTVEYETFMTTEVRPWVKANLSTTGSEQHWLMGFSKSGIGGQDLILKHPDLFSLVASWDFPADMSSYDLYGASPAYGTEANFEVNYELTRSFVDAHKTAFIAQNRIWIGGYDAFQVDISDYNTLLTSEGIAHTMGPSQLIAHRWDSGWVPAALAALHQDSLTLPPGS